jgi:hypothetical protein
MNFHPSIIDFLVSTGFRAESLNDHRVDSVQHPDHPGITVGSLKRICSTVRFRLTFNRYATGDDALRVYVPRKCPVVPPKVIDIAKPRWRKSASAWFQQTVFATQPARDGRESWRESWRESSKACAPVEYDPLAQGHHHHRRDRMTTL